MIVKIANDEGVFIKQDIDDFKYNPEANEVEITFNVEHHNEAGEFIAFKVKIRYLKMLKNLMFILQGIYLNLYTEVHQVHFNINM